MSGHIKGRNMRIYAKYTAGESFESLSMEFALKIPSIKRALRLVDPNWYEVHKAKNKRVEAQREYYKQEKAPKPKVIIPKNAEDVWEKLSKQGHVPARVI